MVTLQTRDGLGSGVVLRPGVVVTNAHVVGNNREVTIIYADGTRSTAQVAASDPVTDVAPRDPRRGHAHRLDGRPDPDRRLHLTG